MKKNTSHLKREEGGHKKSHSLFLRKVINYLLFMIIYFMQRFYSILLEYLIVLQLERNSILQSASVSIKK